MDIDVNSSRARGLCRPEITSDMSEHTSHIGRTAGTVEPFLAFGGISLARRKLIDIRESFAIGGHTCQHGVVKTSFEDVAVFTIQVQLECPVVSNHRE